MNQKRPNKISLPRLDSKDSHGVKPVKSVGESMSQAALRSRRVSINNQGGVGSNVRLNENLNQQQQYSNEDVIHVEDYDASIDADFIREQLMPYLSDLYKDLLMRSNQPDNIDKVTFIEYTKLPGIINDRLHVMFSQNHYKFTNGSAGSQGGSPVSPMSPNNTKKGLEAKKKEEFVTEQSFTKNFTTIFIGDLDQKMKFTFDMYDFDNDGFITPEDIRIMMSYMPFNRHVQIQNVQSMIDNRGIDNLNSGMASPNNRTLQRQKQREGLYQDEEGKNINYNDRISDQEEIQNFTNSIFKSGIAGCSQKHMNYKQYEYINKTVSSEMFYSLMAILHEKLPMATTFFRLKQKFRNMRHGNQQGSSPIRTIASPKMIRGLSITKQMKKDAASELSGSPRSPDVKIRNIRQSEMSRRQSINSRLSNQIGSAGQPNKQSIISQAPGMTKEDSSITDVMGEIGGMSLNQGNFLSREGINPPHSPHKLNRGNKLRRYEEQKSINISNQKDMQELQRNFSPINSQKTFGVRIGLANTKKSQIPTNGDSPSNNRQPMMAVPVKMNMTMVNMTSSQNDNDYDQEYDFPNVPANNAIVQRFGEQETNDDQVYEGQCFLKTKTDRYKEHWAVLAGNELYCYRQKGDTDHRVMHSMIGTFIKEMPDEFSNSENCSLHPVKIVLPPNKSRILYFKSKDNQNEWLDRLKKIVGYSNLFDYYNFEDNLGKGQFGLVKLATHKKTGKKVAIKTVHKKDMKPIEIYQQRREIDVLKMSQHPNIVALIDLFENSDYYYIVLEYMQGKDLFDYIQFRNFKLGEQRVKELSYQIGIAIKYLHSYGIVHRDLKLENVMMSDNTESGVPKLVDFGLAKMIGPNEKADEPFGTLGYVAPEVLRKEPYSFSCDLWSYGCIIYALLSGSLPFDHESQKETIKMTLENKLEFDLPCWNSISENCKDLLVKLLAKDPSKRITLENALKHKWFNGIDLNQKTGIVNNKVASQNFKSKKLNLSSNFEGASK